MRFFEELSLPVCHSGFFCHLNKKIESTKSRIQTHKDHKLTLERVYNMLNDNNICCKKIQDCKDEVDHYIEHNQDTDFEENADMFEELELDKLGLF
jgi:CCR4-NOT transcriptional regulation complex NOT5 subunit